ncbi:enoyl-CoA hydratase-related protein, partial [Pseudomonas asiatica]
MNSEQAKQVVATRQENGVAVVRISRPEAKNALNSHVRQLLAEHFRALAIEPQVRAIVLTGGEECFVAGADIREFAQASPIEMYRRHTEYLWEAISRCPKPVIAAVNGFALGGGCELAMHCDIIVAGESARFG